MYILDRRLNPSGKSLERLRRANRIPPLRGTKVFLLGVDPVGKSEAYFASLKQFWIEDYVTQVSQRQRDGRERPERLGSTDVGVALKRQIWQRELKALAEGRRLKQWVTPSGLAATQGTKYLVTAGPR